MLQLKKEQWFSNIRTDVLAGLVVGLALIPESIAFSAEVFGLNEASSTLLDRVSD